MGSGSLVSIGMPVFNGEVYLPEALDSLLAQDHEHLELIISDNASTDRTPDICMDRAARDKRVRYLRSQENIGPVGNFGRVLQATTAEHFMWAAADDLWEPAYVSTLLASLEADPRAVLAFAGFDNVDGKGEQVRAYPHLAELLSDRLCQRLLNYMLQKEHLGKANLIYGLMRRAALQPAVDMTAWRRGVWGSDMLLVFRVLASGNLVLSEEVLFHKRLILAAPDLPGEGYGAWHPAPAPGRLFRLRSTLGDLHGYFSGYNAVLRAIDLPSAEKRRLKAALRRRATESYLTETRRYVTEVRDEVIWPGLRRLARRN